MAVKYEPGQYWQERLSRDFSLRSAGFLGLGMQYNKWLYRARLRTLNRLLKVGQINPEGKTVLDIGVGTGFYMKHWIKRDVKYIKGIDITEKSISSLKLAYPQYEFIKADITATELPVSDEKFDIITAFDVLFHIVEENKFDQAIKNIKKLSHKETKILIADSFLKKPRSPAFHENDRTMDTYKQALLRAGLEPVTVMPIFYFMSNPIDKSIINSRFVRGLVSLTWAIVRNILVSRKVLGPLGEAVGWSVGLIIYTVDGIVIRFVTTNGPCTKLMLVKIDS